MPFHRRRIRTLAGKVGIKHFDTLITTSGPGSIPTTQVIMDCEAGARTVTGGQANIKQGASTGQECNVGDTIKYINIHCTCFPKSQDAISVGVLEWAVCMVKESETAVPITIIGTRTLGNVCTNMFRNECILTGMIPVGEKQPGVAEIVIKVPKFKQHLRMGDQWRFVTYFRTASSTETSTTAVKQVNSTNFKSYS